MRYFIVLILLFVGCEEKEVKIFPATCSCVRENGEVKSINLTLPQNFSATTPVEAEAAIQSLQTVLSDLRSYHEQMQIKLPPVKIHSTGTVPEGLK